MSPPRPLPHLPRTQARSPRPPKNGPVERVTTGLQTPARIGWGNWFGAQFVLDMTTGVFLIGGNGAQPDAYDLHMFPWYSHYLPWYDRAVTRAKQQGEF